MSESTVSRQRIGSSEPGRSANSALAWESMMKAIVQTRYGSPDVLQLRDVEKPASATIRCWYVSTQRPSISATGIS